MKNWRAIVVDFDETQVRAFAQNGITPVCHLARGKSSLPGCERIRFHHFARYEGVPGEKRPLANEHLQTARRERFAEFRRCADRYISSSSRTSDWTDYELLFMAALEQARNLIDRHRPDCVIFKNAPHRCATVALYAWANATGIPAVIAIQSQFPNLFFLVEDWRDLGPFATSVENGPKQLDFSPPRAAPFYMKNIRKKATSFRQALRQFSEFYLRSAYSPLLLGAPAGEWRINRMLDEVRRGAQGLVLARNRKLMPTVPGDRLPADFVYFPLHLQPEMTTDILGGPWANQILTLNHLRNFVPADIPIVVKENPKQTGHLRGRLFWERLAAIPNVVMVEDSVGGLELVGRAMLTATVTGTAGWEAIRLGKPAMSYGSVFWSHLPGAFRNGECRWEDIQSFRFDAEELAAGMDRLSRVLWDGVCDRAYIPIVEKFDESANAAQVALAFRRHLDGRRNSSEGMAA